MTNMSNSSSNYTTTYSTIEPTTQLTISPSSSTIQDNILVIKIMAQIVVVLLLIMCYLTIFRCCSNRRATSQVADEPRFQMNRNRVESISNN